MKDKQEENQQWKKTDEIEKKKKGTRKVECCWYSSEIYTFISSIWRARVALSLLLFEFLQQAEDASFAQCIWNCECTTRKHTFSVDMCAKRDTTQSPYISIVRNNSWLLFSLCVRVCVLCAFEKKIRIEFQFQFISFCSSSHFISIFRSTCTWVQICAGFNDLQHDFVDFAHILLYGCGCALLLLTMMMIMIMIYVPVFKTLN